MLPKGFARPPIKGLLDTPTIVLALSTILLYVTVLFLFANDYLLPVFTTPLLALLIFASYTPLHEAVHIMLSD